MQCPFPTLVGALLAGLALMPFSAKAGHNSGLNIAYTCLGGNSYEITVNLFRDCSDPQPAATSLNVYIYSSCATLGFESFPLIATEEVSQLCPSALPNSNCAGGSEPGIELSIYQQTVTLENCDDWRIVVAEQNRSSSTNLMDPEVNRIHVEAFLNNEDGACNTSPALGVLNLPYICVSAPLFYNLGFTEPDGDSLVYQLVPALTSLAPNDPEEMEYTGSYSGEEPIAGMTINPVNGQILAAPPLTGIFNAVVMVSEYRNGVLVGQVVQDFLFLINPCPVPTPAPVAGSLTHVSGGGYPVDEQNIGICAGDDFCFEITFSSQEEDYEISVTSTIEAIVPDATLTVSGTNPVTAEFCGTMPPGVTSGSFLVIATDDACPVMGQTFLAIDLSPRNPLEAGTDSLICSGESVGLFAQNGGTHTWSYLSGEEVIAGEGLSCNPCDNPIASPDTTTTYVVTGAYPGSSCANTASVTLTVPLTWQIDVSNESCIGSDGAISIDIIDGSGDYTTDWDDIGTAGLARTGLSAGTYTATVTDAVFGCARTAVIEVGSEDFPIANAGADSEVCGLTYMLNAVPGSAPAGWLTPPAGATLAEPSDPNTSVTVSAEGTYLFGWIEDAGAGCSDTSEVAITFYALPEVAVSAPDTVCGLEASAMAITANATLEWTGPDGLLFDDAGANTTDVSAPSSGTFTAIATGTNGICTATDTAIIHFATQPQADGGAAASVCGNTLMLNANPSVGDGAWILPPELTATPGVDAPSVEITADAYGVFDAIWVETNEGYCADADTVELRFTEQPAVTLGPDTALCGNSLTFDPILPAGELNWLLPAGYSASSPQGIPTEITGPYGSFTIGLSADNGFGCTAVDNQVVTFIETPEISLPPTVAVCGLATSLNAGGAGEDWAWSADPGLSIGEPAPGQADVEAVSDGTYEVTFTTTNGGLCTATAAATLTFFESPELAVSPDVAVCGLGAQIWASYQLGDLSWNLPPGLTSETQPGGDTLAIAAATFGTYTVGVSATNGLCVQADSIVAVFVSTPAIQNPQWECTGTDATFTLSFDAALGNPAAYEVSGLNGSFTDNTFTSEPLPSETPVEVVLADGGSCGADTLSGSLFCPVLSFSGNMNPDTVRICGSTTAIAPPAVGAILDGNDTLLYALHTDPGAGLGEILAWSPAPSFDFAAPMVFETVYYISAVVGNASPQGLDLDDPFLSVSEGTPVVFYALPMATLAGDAMACPYDTVFFEVILSGALPQSVTYSLNGEEITATTGTNLLLIPATTPGTYALVGTASAWCVGEASGSATLGHHPLPEAGLILPDFVCEGTPALLSLEFEGAPPFSFELLHEGVSLGSFQEAVAGWTAEVTAPGAYSVVGLTDTHCTTDEAFEAVLDVRQLPMVDAGPDLIGCSGDTLFPGTPPIAGHTYAWEAHPALENMQSPQPTFVLEHQLPAPASSILVVTAGLNGCFASDSVQVDVYNYPALQISGLAPFCAGDSIAVFAGGGPFVAWSPAGLFSNPTGALTSFSAQVPTEVSVSVSNEGQCASTYIEQVEVWPLPDASFTAQPAEGCAPLDVELIPTSISASHSYRWNTGQSTSTTDGLISETFATAGSFTVSLEVTSPEGCKDRYEWPTPIDVFDTHAKFAFSPEAPSVSEPVVSFFNQSPDGVESLWTFGEVGSSQRRHVDFRFPSGAGARYEVCLLVTSPEGCVDQTCRWVEVADDFFLFIPNAFTPDGDGLNDLFGPVLSHTDLVEYEFWVANRRGQIVFKTNDPTEKWNGGGRSATHYEGNEVYVWKITVKAGFDIDRKEYSGSVILLR